LLSGQHRSSDGAFLSRSSPLCPARALLNIGSRDSRIQVQAVSADLRGELCACIRPADITIAVSLTQSSARNSLRAITRTSAEELDLRPGHEVYAAFKATGVHIMKRGGRT
jgi:ABC-type molybdate transport system ATPase subunit